MNEFISKETIIGKNVKIYPNVFIEGKCKIGDNTTIYPGSFIVDSEIGENCTIKYSNITNSKIGNNVVVGNYSTIRDNAVIMDSAKVGTCVEIKKSIVGKGSKVPHLSYIGDAVIGENVNIGAGAITANYNGKEKNKTIIGDNCFIGTNVNMIAPITVGSNTLVAAGSTINKDVPENSLSIARERQLNKDNYYEKKNK